jgi:hypothetical protein
MVNFNYSYTAAINPPNASPVLTVPQIWAGLQRKIRFAHEFVPVIESCEVISDENDVVTRVVKFKKGMGPGVEGATEVVRGWEPSWVSKISTSGLQPDGRSLAYVWKRWCQRASC